MHKKRVDWDKCGQTNSHVIVNTKSSQMLLRLCMITFSKSSRGTEIGADGGNHKSVSFQQLIRNGCMMMAATLSVYARVPIVTRGLGVHTRHVY